MSLCSCSALTAAYEQSNFSLTNQLIMKNFTILLHYSWSKELKLGWNSG